ncbi:MAG TPA: glycosyltransferase family 2 protein [Bacillota bacterium]|nr:glycosyltransferase family 2 protein [Bacillota bacterium]
MKTTLTVFTPSYNRANTLPALYASLKKQSRKDFEWLIIDDGSTDNTREVVEAWIETEKDFPIYCIHKENGGLHTGYNTAIANMTTELSVCIDSDDMLADGAVEKIFNIWEKQRGDDIAGIVGLDFAVGGDRIGCELKTGEIINAATLLYLGGGDKKYVVRNDLLRTVAPMPVYDGEKNFNPHYLIIKLSKNYRFISLNEDLCDVDYQPDGMSANIMRQFINSPRSFAELRRAIMELGGIMKLSYRYKNAAHYVSSCMLSRQKRFLASSPDKLITVLAVPAGVVLTLFVKKKVRRMDK